MDASTGPQGQQHQDEAMPTWAQTLVRMVQAQAERMEQVEGHLAASQHTASTESIETPAITTSSTQPELTSSYETRRRDLLPDPPEFNGNKTEFLPWLDQVQAKLAVDRADKPEIVRFWYIHSRLRGKALAQVSPWVSVAQYTQTQTVERLIGQLRLAYEDPQSKERAASRLGSLKQDKKSFSTFIADFERLVLEAGGAEWADTAKRAFLSNAISDELKAAIVATPMPATYVEYCSLLHGASQNLEALRRDRRKLATARTKPYSYQQGATDTMEWEPTSTVTVAKAQPAKWVSEEEINRRRSNGLCLRCGKDGHFVRECKVQPAKKPKGATAPTGVATAQVEEKEDDSDESGKE
jgi:hypothetical protein